MGKSEVDQIKKLLRKDKNMHTEEGGASSGSASSGSSEKNSKKNSGKITPSKNV